MAKVTTKLGCVTCIWSRLTYNHGGCLCRASTKLARAFNILLSAPQNWQVLHEKGLCERRCLAATIGKDTHAWMLQAGWGPPFDGALVPLPPGRTIFPNWMSQELQGRWRWHDRVDGVFNLRQHCTLLCYSTLDHCHQLKHFHCHLALLVLPKG